MWPWAHLGFAYILYSLYARGRFGRPPRPEPVLAVAFGSQLPDIVDKPLAWYGVLPSGRSLAHSLLFAAVLVIVVYAVGVVLDRVETATALVIAHLSHLVTDLPPRVALGYPSGSEYLFWPFLSQNTFRYRAQAFEPPVAVEVIVTPFTDPVLFSLYGVFLFVTALGLWYVDGCPGLQYVRSGSSTR